MDKNAPEDLKLDYAYVVDDQELAYIAIANITSTYKELEAFYNEKKRMLHVYSYGRDPVKDRVTGIFQDTDRRGEGSL